FLSVLVRVAFVFTIRDDANSSLRCVFDELSRLVVKLDALHSQLSRTPHTREERRKNDRQNKERSDLDAFRSFVNVLQGRVDENDGNQQIRIPVLLIATRGKSHRDSGGSH